MQCKIMENGKNKSEWTRECCFNSYRKTRKCVQQGVNTVEMKTVSFPGYLYP